MFRCFLYIIILTINKSSNSLKCWTIKDTLLPYSLWGNILTYYGLGSPEYSIDGNRWLENQSINRYQSIKLVNWYWLVLANRWSIDNHIKIVHRLASIGTGPRNRRHARYLSDHPPFLGSPGDEIGKTIPTQTSQRKEYTLLHAYLNYPLARHCLSVS